MNPGTPKEQIPTKSGEDSFLELKAGVGTSIHSQPYVCWSNSHSHHNHINIALLTCKINAPTDELVSEFLQLTTPAEVSSYRR